MRILLFAGKGGVGKTSVAAATGALIASSGRRTLVMSLDPAHSLSDAFDLDRSLMDTSCGAVVPVAENLWIQELDVHEEISKHWGEVHQYIALLLNTSGIDEILAEELAILPGMEEIAALLYVNQYVREGSFDVILLDCAPTAESIRFISLPKTLDWYMRKVFRLERQLMRYMRPMARRWADIPLPEDGYFVAVERLFHKLQGVDGVLTDPDTTSVRLVTNLEKMVLRETQRAYMFFSLHQLTVDAVVVNRVFGEESKDAFLRSWQDSQKAYLKLAEEYFHPLPLMQAPFYQREILGYERLFELGRELYGKTDPASVQLARRPIEFLQEDGQQIIRLHLPFAQKGEVDLVKVGEELIVKVGAIKRNLVLPRTYIALQPLRAKLEGDRLVIVFGGDHAGRDDERSTS
jgi:arsenite/tail-anchored protein-transporting ATPase